MEEAGLEVELVGEILDGRFRVEAKLGQGGMGTVWRVEHVVSLQRFALKTLDRAVSAVDEAHQRFLREARAAAALRTRHVVKIVDAQMQYVHQGRPLPFLVMELLEGKTLQELLDTRGRLAPGELVWMTGQLGRALDAAHRQGIVHRDLKPSNVFIAEDEERQPIVKLCDFGIAKLLDPAGEPGVMTRTGALLGTPMYLAPELLRGAATAVPATDQWSLGLIAFRALAGLEYFGHVRGFPDLVLTIANDPLVPPSSRAPGLTSTFDAWFARSCARNPGDRFPDVPAQVGALEAALGRPAAIALAPMGLAPAAPSLSAVGATALPTVPPRAGRGPKGTTSTRRRARSPARRVFFASALVWAIAALGLMSWLGGRRQRAVETPIARPIAASAPAPEPAPSAPPAAPMPLPPSTTLATTGEAEAPAPRREPPRAARPRAPAPGPARRLPKGATCQRSAECASGLCAAETCL